MAGEEPDYVIWVRQQPCCVPGCVSWSGFSEAHHAGIDRGLSQRAHDNTCIPFCTQHHVDWHGASGPFRQMDRSQRRTFALEQIALIQERWRDQTVARTRHCGFCGEPGHVRADCWRLERLRSIAEAVRKKRP